MGEGEGIKMEKIKMINDNVKISRRGKDGFSKISCKSCGSVRITAKVVNDPNNEGHGSWLMLNCGKCGVSLYYNGA